MSNRIVTESTKEYNELIRRFNQFFGRKYYKLLVKLIDEKGFTFADIARMMGKSVPMIRKEYLKFKKEGGVK